MTRAINSDRCTGAETNETINTAMTDTVHINRDAIFASLHDASPDNGPYFCTGCWETLETNVKATENRSLTDYTQGT